MRLTSIILTLGLVACQQPEIIKPVEPAYRRTAECIELKNEMNHNKVDYPVCWVGYWKEDQVECDYLNRKYDLLEIQYESKCRVKY